MNLPTGSKLGPYLIERLIASGGMADVYQARDPRLNRAVALKVLKPAAPLDADQMDRFAEEAWSSRGRSPEGVRRRGLRCGAATAAACSMRFSRCFDPGGRFFFFDRDAPHNARSVVRSPHVPSRADD